MWGPLTRRLEPTLGRPPDHDQIPFRCRGPGDPNVIFYRRNTGAGPSLHLPHWSGHAEWPEHVEHWLMPGVGFLEMGKHSGRVWGVHAWADDPRHASLRLQTLLSWARERLDRRGPVELCDRLERSLDLDVLETPWMTACEEHWMLRCLRLPVPEDTKIASAGGRYLKGPRT